MDDVSFVHAVEGLSDARLGGLAAVRPRLASPALGSGHAQPGGVRRAVRGAVPVHRPAAGDPARPAHPPGRHACARSYLYPLALSFIVTGTAWKWMLNPGPRASRSWCTAGASRISRFDWIVNEDMAIYTRRDRRRVAGVGLRHGDVSRRAARHRSGDASRPPRSTAHRCPRSTGTSSSRSCARCF